MAHSAGDKQVLVLAALAQPTRLQILSRIAEAGSMGLAAGQIARSLRCPPSTLSFHLKELSRTGILEATPRGRFIIYGLQRTALQDLARYIGALAGAAAGSRVRRVAGARSEPGRRAGDPGQLQMCLD